MVLTQESIQDSSVLTDRCVGEIGKPEYVLNNSFGMLGINSVVIIERI